MVLVMLFFLQNKHNLGASAPLSIRLIDVNDNIPTFTEVVSGFVLENEPPGTAVMQVRAIDADSSPEHNQVRYFYPLTLNLVGDTLG